MKTRMSHLEMKGVRREEPGAGDEQECVEAVHRVQLARKVWVARE
jgi:hypothetical protein